MLEKKKLKPSKRCYEDLHQIMDEQIAKRQKRLAAAEEERDSNKLWDLITAAFEGAAVQYFELQGTQAEKMRGRSKVQIDCTKVGPKVEVVHEDMTTAGAELRRLAGKHHAQANRLNNVARRMKATGSGVAEQKLKEVNLQLIENTIDA